MVVTGISELDKYTRHARIVEFVSKWSEHVEELALLIRKLALKSEVHIVFYNNTKYVNLYDLYNELEPYIETLDKVTVFWEDNIEALIYHIILLGKTKKGVLLLILPYSRKMAAQVENTYMYRLRKTIEKACRNGWEVVIINPVREDGFWKKNYLADITLYMDFIGSEAIVKVIDARQPIKPPIAILNK